MSKTSRYALLLSLAAPLVALAAQADPPNRVFDSRKGAFADFAAMATELARADIVLVGEQHDDPNTHRIELAILQAISERGRGLVVSLEMFERDVQEPLDHFQMGHLTEQDFLKDSRPWPRYATDYKPLVDFAIAHNFPVIAANVPRPIAAEVAKSGLDVLRQKSESDRKLFASDLKCPLDDEYFKRFVEAMGSHPAEGAAADEAQRTAERYYYAQCLKDETMAESIAQSYALGPSGDRRPAIVHFNGSFHSDYHQGTAARVARRLLGAKILVVTVTPVTDMATVAVSDDDRKKADFVVYTATTSFSIRSPQSHTP